MSIKFTWTVIKESEKNHFLQPWGFLISINSIENTLTKYELEHGFPPTESARDLVPHLLADQINTETGISTDMFSVRRGLFSNSDRYRIVMYNPEAYVMFKLIYGGEVAEDNESQ